MVGADGRGRAFVNDQPASVGLLRRLGETLVEIQGQMDQHGLLDVATHRASLDAFAGLKAERFVEVDPKEGSKIFGLEPARKTVTVTTQGNPVFLIFGIVTLPLFGLGLVFILLYFLLPRNFLVAHSNNYITALNCRGPLDKYHEFADMVTQAAIGKQEGAQESGHGARTHAVVAPPQLAPPLASVRCPGCGTEYKLPPNAAGRRLRCHKCQSLVG